jgi:hypothetical protein
MTPVKRPSTRAPFARPFFILLFFSSRGMVSILALSSSLKTLHISSEFEPLCAPLPITNYTHLRSYRVAKHFGLLSNRVKWYLVYNARRIGPRTR